MAPSGPSQARTFAFVGCYTPGETKGTGSGVALVRLDPASGALSLVRTTPMHNASWVALDRRQRTLYAVNEDRVYRQPDAGSVTAYAIDPADYSLTSINSVSSGSMTPCYLSVAAGGRHLLVANYDGGTLAVLPIRPDGGLGAATDNRSEDAPANPGAAGDNPPGNHAFSDHAGPRMHMIRTDPSGRWVVAADAGRDRLLLFSLDPATGRLKPAPTPFVALEPGCTPRHLVFGRHGRRIYVLCEQDAVLRVLDFDPRAGTATLIQAVPMLPRGFGGSNLSAELLISQDGRFLYGTQRLYDAVTVMAVGDDGQVRVVDETWTRGDYPRGCTIDPSQRFLFCCNQKGDNVTSFRVDRDSGKLRFTERFLPLGSPVTISFLS